MHTLTDSLSIHKGSGAGVLSRVFECLVFESLVLSVCWVPNHCLLTPGELQRQDI